MGEKLINKDISRILDEINTETFKDASVLITGGAGFIGSWLCDVLVKAGARVTCLANNLTAKTRNVHFKS